MTSPSKNKTTKPTSSFKDPYGHIPLEERVRLQTYLDKNDHAYIRCLRPNGGTMTIVQNTLWSKLIIALKKHGLSDYTHISQFETAITNLTINLPDESKVSGGTVGRVVAKTRGGLHGRGTKGIRSTPESKEGVTTEL